MRMSFAIGGTVCVFMTLFCLPSARAAPGRIAFEGFLFPDNVIVNSMRTMTLCLVNQGSENDLIYDGKNEDRLMFYIPMGPAQTDLESDGTQITCSVQHPGWACSVDYDTSRVEVELRPSAEAVTVAESETICFDFTGIQINEVAGLAFCDLEQFIKWRSARRLIERPLAVFKMETGAVRHDDLSEVREDQHHAKTTTFSELSGEVADEQIRDDITIIHALSADTSGFAANADKVDGLHGADLAAKADVYSRAEVDDLLSAVSGGSLHTYRKRCVATNLCSCSSGDFIVSGGAECGQQSVVASLFVGICLQSVSSH